MTTTIAPGTPVALSKAIHASRHAAGGADAITVVDSQLPATAQAATLSSTFGKVGIDSTQRLMALLRNETQGASVLVVTDSTGVSADRWVYRWTVMLAADWPRWTVLHHIWDDAIFAYDAPTTVQTGTGSQTLDVYSGAVTGVSSTGWQSHRCDAGIYALNPNVVIVSLGHNEGAGQSADTWHSQYVSLTESISERLPSADIILIGQNPATANTYQQARIEVYREIAVRRGYGFIDIQQVFLDSGNAPGLTSDGVHPTSAGSILWANTVHAAFTYQPGSSVRPQRASSFLDTATNLIGNGDFSAFASAAPDNWSHNLVTTTKDTTNFESVNGYAVACASTGAGSNLIAYAPAFRRARGRWVTFAARVYIPPGATVDACRLGLFDGVGSTLTQLGECQPTDGFRWFVVSRLIAAAATHLYPYIYVFPTAGTGTITIDRTTLTFGKYPRSQ